MRRAIPELSVLIPLEDPRGDGAKHLRTWSAEQSLDRERYQLVLASGGDDEAAESRARAELAPHDALDRAPGQSLIGLWNAAAARADADWLLLTENHCEADPACLAAVARAIAERGDDHEAFTLEHGHITATATGDLNARWFDEVYEDWARPGQWTRLNLVGFVIRRDAFEGAGGLEPDYGLFSAPFLSARLDDQGARVGHVPEARVLHVHPDEIHEHHEHSADFAWGECEARRREGRDFFERYFGAAPGWVDQAPYQPRLARQELRALCSCAARAAIRGRRDLPWLFRELLGRVPGALTGPRLRELGLRLDFSVSEYVAAKLPAPPDVRWRAFLRAQDRVLGLTQSRWVSQRGGGASPRPGVAGEQTVETLAHDALMGVHALERHDRGAFRWTEPVATLRLARPGGPSRLRLATNGLRGTPHEHVRAVYLDGHKLPATGIASDGAALVVDLPAGRPGETSTLTLLSRPLEPRRLGSSDTRRLGLPVFGVALQEA